MTKHLIITGASKGIGYATAQKFLQDDWVVSNLSRTACDLPSVQNYRVDLAIPTEIEAVKENLTSTLADADTVCIVHNAAAYVQDSVIEHDPSKLRYMFEVNVVAPMMLNQMLIPHLPKGSSIIYLGSTLAEKAIKNSASYVITKHAVGGLMRSTAQDLFGTGIHTCCVNPGFTNTEMVRARLAKQPGSEQFIKDFVAFGRLIEPTEIADFIFYCSQNPIVNGSMLHVNLGQKEY